MADAITRTLYRLYVTHRNLLEWTTAAQSKVSPQPDLGSSYRQMAGGTALGLAVSLLSISSGPSRLADCRPVRVPLARGAGDRLLGKPVAHGDATPHCVGP